jgi:hypothetical protein
MYRITAVLLGLGAMGVFGLNWQLLLVACVVELLRLGNRVGALVPTAGACALGLFLVSRVYLTPDADEQRLAVALLGLGAYFVGYTLSCDGWHEARAAVLSLVAGSAAHALLNLGLILRDFGLLPTTRLFVDVWTGELWVATGQATLWVPVVGAIPFFLFGQSRKLGRLVGWVSLALVLWAAAVLASRTLLGLIAVSFVVGSGLVLTRREQISRLVSGVGLAATAAILTATVVPRAFLDGLPLVSRLASGETSVVNDPRTERWAFYLDNMWEWSQGGRHLQESVGYAHNLWLDTYDADGAIPFVLLLVFTGTFVSSLVRLARSPDATSGQILLMVGVGVAWLVQASTEPLMDLAPYLFAAGCGFAGATAGLLRSMRPKTADSRRRLRTSQGLNLEKV